MRRFSITDKLIIASLALSIVTIMIVASYSFYNAKEAILERTFNQLTSVRVIKSNLIEKFFSNCIKEVQLAKSSSDIHEILKQLNKAEKREQNCLKDTAITNKSPFVQEILESYYTSIFVIGKNQQICYLKDANYKNGKTRLNEQNIWDQTYSSGQVNISDLSKPDSLSQAVITLSSKISDEDGNMIGMIVFEISPNSIDSIMLESNPENGLGISGESYLVGSDYLLRSSSRFQDNSVLNTLVRTEAVDAAFQNVSGSKIIQDYRGIKVLSSFGKIPIPSLNWAIITEIDYQEATVPIYSIRNEIIFISIFIFFLVLMVIFFLSRKITIPIQKLNDAAHEIGKGNLDLNLKSNLSDEIGELTEAFNKMASDLKAERVKSLGSLIDGQETERQRLSRELHDSLGQLLIGLKLKYESCINQSSFKNSSKEKFEELGSLFDKTIEETRRISNNLMPAALSEFGLVSAIRNICNQMNETSQIHIQFSVQGSNNLLNQKSKTYIFRIAQEALTNIVKHAQAKNASVQLSFDEKYCNLKIEDDGIGFDTALNRKENSNGLNNIYDRVKLLSGKYDIQSQNNKGTRIIVEIPITQKEDE